MIRERNLEVNTIVCVACTHTRHSLKTTLFPKLNFQVSSSYNESKEEITLDEVRDKFFQLCRQNAVSVDEPSNSID